MYQNLQLILSVTDYQFHVHVWCWSHLQVDRSIVAELIRHEEIRPECGWKTFHIPIQFAMISCLISFRSHLHDKSFLLSTFPFIVIIIIIIINIPPCVACMRVCVSVSVCECVQMWRAFSSKCNLVISADFLFMRFSLPTLKFLLSRSIRVFGVYTTKI